jgi:hypothetical protein
MALPVPIERRCTNVAGPLRKRGLPVRADDWPQTKEQVSSAALSLMRSTMIS